LWECTRTNYCTVCPAQREDGNPKVVSFRFHILSNLLLVLGSSLLCGGLANTGKECPLDRVRMQLNSTIVLPVELRNRVLEKITYANIFYGH
jgi:hypothetical protein